MIVTNNNFGNFKSYNQIKKQTKPSVLKEGKNKDYKKFIKPLAGSSLGVAAGFLAAKNVKCKNRVVDELVHLFAMIGGANIGSVALCSIGEKPEKIKKKAREGAFQIMNATIPLLMVGAANEICDRTIGKTKPVLRIAASLGAMALGAFSATKITNLTKDKNEPPRKYTIKDSVANVDDLVATLNIGLEDKVKNLCLDTRLMPFIYAYCGMRAGAKE